MAQFSQRFIRSIIESVWEQAPKGASTFLEALKAGREGYWEKTETGWQVQSSSGAGYSTSFHIPTSNSDPNSVTPAALQDLFQQIIEYYRVVVSQFGLTESDDGTFEDSPFAQQLCALFPTIKGFTNNFMYATP